MEITENAPTVDPNLTTRVHPSTKGLSFKQKREDLRAANMTTQPVLVEQEESQFLPIIPTHRSITQVGPQDDQQEEWIKLKLILMESPFDRYGTYIT